MNQIQEGRVNKHYNSIDWDEVKDSNNNRIIGSIPFRDGLSSRIQHILKKGGIDLHDLQSI